MNERRVIVTGVGSGIGKATAVVLAERGYDIGMTYGTNADARRMIADSIAGRIVNVSSVHEMVPLMDAAAYCCSKAGIGMLTKCMALELAPYGITVTAIAPGETATAMSGSPDESVTGKERQWIPVGRPGKSREMALTVAHLVDPEIAYTTGTTIVVDGGLLLMAAIPNQKVRNAASQP